MNTPLTPDHMQEIRERLGSTLPVRKSDAEALLAEADRLRAESDQLYSDLTGAYLDRWEEAQDNIRLRQALASAQRGRRELRSRMAELESAESTVIADRDAQIIAWLGKKAGEYHGLSRSRQESAADAIARMADKLSRGAVRPPVPSQVATETNEAQQAKPAPQCPEALYSPETDTLRRCTRGPHDWRDWHETESGTQWRHATEEQSSPTLDDPFSKDPWTDVPTS